MNKFAAFFLVLLITVSPHAVAEPSEDVQKLMDEKLSMLDWGPPATMVDKPKA